MPRLGDYVLAVKERRQGGHKGRFYALWMERGRSSLPSAVRSRTNSDLERHLGLEESGQARRCVVQGGALDAGEPALRAYGNGHVPVTALVPTPRALDPSVDQQLMRKLLGRTVPRRCLLPRRRPLPIAVGNQELV